MPGIVETTQVGRREALDPRDKIYRVQSEETPFTRLIPRGSRMPNQPLLSEVCPRRITAHLLSKESAFASSLLLLCLSFPTSWRAIFPMLKIFWPAF